MLKKVKAAQFHAKGTHFAIVASEYNAEYVDSMLRGAVRVLKDAKVSGIRVVRVPGAYEIPVAAQRLARRHSPCYSGVICLGVILRGETTHAQFIGEAVTHALMNIQVESEVPVIHEVLLLENREQARVRCLNRKHNRGREAAQTALTMAGVMEGLRLEQPLKPRG
jgi:6,7-dimethyl-8-ribityllumazine synthase